LHSADASAVNSDGQTAKDIAEFSLHDAVVGELSPLPQRQSMTTDNPVSRRQLNYFCDSPLDRASELRTEPEWLTDAFTANSTTYILFVKLDLVIQETEDRLPHLQRFTYREMRSLLESYKPTVVFLGVEREPLGSHTQPQNDR